MRVHFLILAVLLGALKLEAQVYAVGPAGPYRGPPTIVRVDEHTWLASRFGLVQFRARNGEGARWVRQTTVHLGASSFTVRLPAFAIVAIASTPLLLLLTVIACRVRSRHRNDSRAA
jgi:hypothetical protein